MTRSATDIMQDILYAAVIDSIAAMKAASKGVPNTLLRNLNSVHANSTFADLPPELQAAISASVRAAFTRLLREGYTVSPSAGEPIRGPSSHRSGGGPAKPPHPRGGRPARIGEPGRPPRKDGERGPPRGGRPGRGPRPGGK